MLKFCYESVENLSELFVTQISANVSPDTRDRLERYVRARGLKKGFVIEQALLHHLQAVSEIPDDAVVPPRLVVGPEVGDRLLERLAAKEPPNRAMQALFDESVDQSPTERP
jgi:hypothetical protein